MTSIGLAITSIGFARSGGSGRPFTSSSTRETFLSSLTASSIGTTSPETLCRVD